MDTTTVNDRAGNRVRDTPRQGDDATVCQDNHLAYIILSNLLFAHARSHSDVAPLILCVHHLYGFVERMHVTRFCNNAGAARLTRGQQPGCSAS